MANKSGIKAGQAYVELHADDSALKRGLRSAQTTIRDFGQSIQDIGQKMMMASGAVGAGFGVATQRFASTGDELAKMNQRTGMSIEFLSKLKVAMSLTDAEFKEMADTMEEVSDFMLRLEEGTGGLKKLFEGTGITLERMKDATPEEQFEMLANAIANTEDPARRMQRAVESLRGSGRELMPLLRNYNEAMRMAQEFQIPAEAAQSAVDLKEEFILLTTAARRVVFWIGHAIADEVTAFIEKIGTAVLAVRDWIKENQDLVLSAAKLTLIIGGVGAALVALGLSLKVVAAGIGTLIGVAGLLKATLIVLTKTVTGFYLVMGLVKVATSALSVVWGVWQKIMVASIAVMQSVRTAISAISGAVTFMAGTITAASNIIQTFMATLSTLYTVSLSVIATAALIATGIGAVVVAVGAFIAVGLVGYLGSVITAAGALLTSIGGLISAFGTALVGAVMSSGAALKRIAGEFGDFASQAVSSIRGAVSQIGNMLNGALSTLADWAARTRTLLELAFRGIKAGEWKMTWDLIWTHAKASLLGFVIWAMKQWMQHREVILEILGDLWGEVWQSAKSNLWEPLKAEVTTFANKIRDDIGTAVDDVAEKIDGWIEKLDEAMEKVDKVVTVGKKWGEFGKTLEEWSPVGLAKKGIDKVGKGNVMDFLFGSGEYAMAGIPGAGGGGKSEGAGNLDAVTGGDTNDWSSRWGDKYEADQEEATDKKEEEDKKQAESEENKWESILGMAESAKEEYAAKLEDLSERLREETEGQGGILEEELNKMRESLGGMGDIGGAGAQARRESAGFFNPFAEGRGAEDKKIEENTRKTAEETRKTREATNEFVDIVRNTDWAGASIT